MTAIAFEKVKFIANEPVPPVPLVATVSNSVFLLALLEGNTTNLKKKKKLNTIISAVVVLEVLSTLWLGCQEVPECCPRIIPP